MQARRLLYAFPHRLKPHFPSVKSLTALFRLPVLEQEAFRVSVWQTHARLLTLEVSSETAPPRKTPLLSPALVFSLWCAAA